MPWVAAMMTTEFLRPSLSLMAPQASRPMPLASEKNTAMAVPAIASASAASQPAVLERLDREQLHAADRHQAGAGRHEEGEEIR